MMKNKEKLKERFLRDPLPLRLGALSATLGRISSSARNSNNPEVVTDLLDEAKYLIEWTAAEAKIETAAELVRMQRLITLWLSAWHENNKSHSQRVLLSVQAKNWSDKAVDFSGLL